MTLEEWRPISDYEGLYEVSEHGRVRSLDKRVKSRWGSTRLVKGKLLLGDASDTGHVRVYLYRSGSRARFLVHRLVARAFIPNPNGYPFVLHWDDDAGNNDVTNLRWGNTSENGLDNVRNGNHPESRKTHCPYNHPYSEDNTYVNSKGFRRCLICREYRRTRGLPESDSRHGSHTGYSNYGCRCDACKLVGPYPKSRQGGVSIVQS